MKTKTLRKRVKKGEPLREHSAYIVEGNYTAKIKVLGKVYTAIASSPLEAIKALQVGKTAKGVSVLTIGKPDGSWRSVILPHFKTARLFSPHPMTREVALKNTSLFFDNL